MSNHRLIEAWREYVHKVLPTDAPQIQEQECHKAFMAGCAVTLGLLKMDVTMAELANELMVIVETEQRNERAKKIN